MALAPVPRDLDMVPRRPMTASPRVQPNGPSTVGGYLAPAAGRHDSSGESVTEARALAISEVKQLLVEQASALKKEIAECTEKAVETFVHRVNAACTGAERRASDLQKENERLEVILVNASLLPHSTGGTGEMPHPSPRKQRGSGQGGEFEEGQKVLRFQLDETPACGGGLRPSSTGGGGSGRPGTAGAAGSRPIAGAPLPAATLQAPPSALKKAIPYPSLHQVPTPMDSAPSMPGFIASDPEENDDDAMEGVESLRLASMFAPDGHLPGVELDDVTHSSRRVASRERSSGRRSFFSSASPDADLFGDSDSDDGFTVQKPNAVFADASQMKEKIRAAVSKNAYNVCNYYWETGYAQFIARHHLFDSITLGVIFANGIWVSIDTDYNDADLLLQADPLFIAAENIFCMYFTFELAVRFLAFKKKYNCLFDFWFVFDSLMAIMMILETWIMTAVLFLTNRSPTEAPPFDPAVLKLFRLMRLSRMARMARLLRAMPELMILIKGMFVATRSVFFTLILLMIIMYVFAIAIRQLTKGTDTGDKYFESVPGAMLHLLLRGILPDQAEIVWYSVNDKSTGVFNRFLFASLMLSFILVGSLTVMNMLVGVLVEVVKVVSSVEKESLVVNFVKSQLLTLLTDTIDTNGDKKISKEEFHSILVNKKAAMVLEEVGVDVVGLVDFQDFIFREKECLSFATFMEVVLQLRGSNTATVRDIVDLRKFMSEELKRLEDSSRKFISKSAHRKSHGNGPVSSQRFSVGSSGDSWVRSMSSRSLLDLDADDGMPPRFVPPQALEKAQAELHKLTPDFANFRPSTPSNPAWVNEVAMLGLSQFPTAPAFDQFEDLDMVEEEVMADVRSRSVPTMEC